MSPEDYREIVKNVYLTPIRSVLVVDDEYPSMQKILAYEGDVEKCSETFKWFENRSVINSIIEKLRVRYNKRRIIDISDNLDFMDQDDGIIGHLHQCDLLVLDYEISGDDGKKAIKAISKVLNNNQFNLVVVHTSHNIDEIVFDSVLLPLLGKIPIELSEDDIAIITETQENLDGKAGGFDKISNAINFGNYKSIRQDKNQITKECLDKKEFEAIKTMFRELDIIEDRWVCCLKYAINEFQNKYNDKFSACNKSASELIWNSKSPNYWIACPEGFISFIKKGTGIDIEECLLNSLTHWKPTPSQMLFSEIRNQIDDIGIRAEIDSHKKLHAHAKWYSELLLKNGFERSHVSISILKKYFEMLEETIQAKILFFLNEMCLKDWTEDKEKKHIADLCNATSKTNKSRIVIEKKLEINRLVDNLYDINLNDKTHGNISDLEHNIFVSNKSPSLLHLELGHIFKTGDDYWICLTPPCDMIPERNKGFHKGDLKQHKPFAAVKLHKIEENDRNFIKVQSNRFIFTDFGEFCFNRPKEEDSAPNWYPLYAHENGYLEDHKFTYSRLAVNEDGNLFFEKNEAAIISQLRYEYAINLMARLAANMQRVGLDYSGK